MAVVVAAAASFLFPMWKKAIDTNGGGEAEPFRIAGNFYFVGTADSSIFLITGPQGHILLDSGRQGAAPMVMASIAKLGFNIKDVKVLINSDPRGDHAGAFAAIKNASGAALWASEPSARAIEAGGDDPDAFWVLRGLIRVGLLQYPAAHVDHIFKDGDTVGVGPIALTAHVTGGYTRGCTSWSFPVRDGTRELTVVSVCRLNIESSATYPQAEADVERSLAVLRGIKADIWVTANTRPWGRYRKFEASQSMKNPADAFIDREGYRDFLDAAERDLRTHGEH